MLDKFMDLWLWPIDLSDDHWWQRVGSLLIFIFWVAVTFRLALAIAAILAVIDLIRGEI